MHELDPAGQITRWVCCCCWFWGLAVPAMLPAQSRTYLTCNAPALLIGTLDLELEQQLSRTLSWQLSGGFRSQRLGPDGKPLLSLLTDYVQLRNQGAFLGAGIRLSDPFFNDYEYPFICLDLVGSYFNEDIAIRPSPRQPFETQRVQGVRFGVVATLGFTLRLSERFYFEPALQLAYSPPRSDLLAYYLPGIGYTLFGYGFLGFPGAHMQPLLSLKYTLIRSQRDRLRTP